MIRLFNWLVFGYAHKHIWKIIKETKLYRNNTTELSIGTGYTLQCEKCGNIKYKRV